ncbi:MAG: ATP-binding cassette domain-containing protein [Propionibacteriaceae bacterium]|nr:ATP-binding cassette domain-containing protein [Propionibacteriaceae bacterium]
MLLAVRGVLSLAMGGSSAVVVYLVAVLVSSQGSLDRAATLILALAGCLAIIGIFPSLANLIDSQVARLFAWKNQAALLESVESVAQLGPFEDPEYQSLLHGANDAADAYVRGAVSAANSVVQTLTSLAGVLWLLASQDWRMAVLPLLWGLPAIYFFNRAARARMSCFVASLYPRRRQMRFRATATDMQTLGELKVDRAEAFIAEQALASMAQAHMIELESDSRVARDQFAASALTALAAVTPLALGEWGGFGGSFQLAIVIQAALPLSGSITQLGTLTATLSQAYRERGYLSAYLERCRKERDRCTPTTPITPLPPRIHSVVFEDVWFTYPGSEEPALKGLSLTLQQGRSYALTGENGSGKSTVLKLIGGLYYPTRGRILIDGQDIRTLDLRQLRDRIAYLAQDAVRLDLSIAENLMLGYQGPTNLERALDVVGLSALTHRSRKGLQTVLSQAMVDNDQAGTMISGGQWRRLAVARYSLRAGRDICLLDEPTNAIDARGEDDLLAGPLGPRPDSIWLAVTHRPAVCRVADETLVLANGRLHPERPLTVHEHQPVAVLASSDSRRQ